MIPGVNLPKLPKFHTDGIQATREVASVVLPTIGLSMAGVGAGGAAAKASKLKWLMIHLLRS